MTPDELRLATDPAARNDPEFVRRVTAGRRRQNRDRALGFLRVTNFVMAGVGALMLAVSGLLVAGALASMVLPVGAPQVPLATAATPTLIGIVFVGLAIWLWVPSRSLPASWVHASATVVQVLSMGGTFRIKGPGYYATISRVTVLLRVTPANAAPYEVTYRDRIIDTDLSRLQVGATLPVRVSPSRPQKLAIDWDALG